MKKSERRAFIAGYKAGMKSKKSQIEEDYETGKIYYYGTSDTYEVTEDDDIYQLESIGAAYSQLIDDANDLIDMAGDINHNGIRLDIQDQMQQVYNFIMNNHPGL